VPLLVAGIGLIGALSGGVVGSVLTQRQADKRENIAWARERERQQEERDREDRARTFEHRREAYLDFYVAVKALARTAYNHSYGFTEPELAEGWQDDAFSKLHCLEFYADRELAALHRRHMARLGPGASTGSTTTLMNPDFDEREQRCDNAELVMVGLMRRRLSIREGDLELPPGYSDHSTDHAAVDPSDHARTEISEPEAPVT